MRALGLIHLFLGIWLLASTDATPEWDPPLVVAGFLMASGLVFLWRGDEAV